MRKTFDPDVPLPPHGYVQEDKRQPCRWCDAPTSIATLNQYGARCFGCYESYCRNVPEATPYMADKRKGEPKAWAHSLKAREESGERLSPTQRQMWRAAFGPQLSEAEVA